MVVSRRIIGLIPGAAAVFLNAVTPSALAGDFGYRWVNKKCLSGRSEGRNPDFLGQCGVHVRSDFKRRVFRAVDLSGSNFNEARFRYAEFSETRLEFCQFEQSDLSHAILDRVIAPYAKLSFSTGVYAALSYSNFVGANFLQIGRAHV